MALLQVYSSVNTKKLVISSVYFYILYVVVLPVFLSSSFWGVHKSIFHQHFSSTSQLMSSLQCTSALMEMFCIKLLNLIQQVTMNHLCTVYSWVGMFTGGSLLAENWFAHCNACHSCLFQLPWFSPGRLMQCTCSCKYLPVVEWITPSVKSDFWRETQLFKWGHSFFFPALQFLDNCLLHSVCVPEVLFIYLVSWFHILMCDLITCLIYSFRWKCSETWGWVKPAGNVALGAINVLASCIYCPQLLSCNKTSSLVGLLG